MISKQQTSSQAQSYNDIVISGMSGKFPNCKDVQDYVTKLTNKIDLCGTNLRSTEIEHPEVPKLAGRLINETEFDVGMFGTHALQSKFIEVGGRILMQEVTRALFDAGITPDEIRGSKTGVFMGSCGTEYQLVCHGNPPRNSGLITGVMRSMNAERVSYYLQVNGPSVNCDAACSSSMMALDTAYRSIISGKCERAIVGGLNICLESCLTLQFARLGVLNPGTGCRPFDKNANGYTRSEAVAAIILQKQPEAKRVYAHMIHTKSNADGYKREGITFPSMKQQLQLLKEVYQEAQVSSDDIGFLEAHGTGTLVGDPEELTAIDSFFQRTSRNPLLIGSVKGNVGHSEPSAALCSIVKSLSVLNTGKIIPNIHYDSPRGESLVEKRLIVVTEVMDFPPNKEFAGVNSFGFGGANGHIILKKFKKPKNALDANKLPPMIVFYSARTKGALDTIHKAIIDSNNVEFMNLLQESFKQPIANHMFRGFTIIGSNINAGSKLNQMKPGNVLLILTNFKERNYMSDLHKISFSKNILQEITKEIPNFPNYNSSTVLQLFIIAILKKLFPNMNIYEFDELSKLITKYIQNTAKLIEVSQQITTCNGSSHKANQQFITEFVLSNSKFGTKPTIIMIGENNIIVGDKIHRRCNIVHFDDFTPDKFLFNLGLLYQYGYDISLDKLFTPAEFPVNCGTNILASVLEFNKKLIPYPKLVTQLSYKPEIIRKIWKGKIDTSFIRGHLIDNKILYPATGYLHLVWLHMLSSQSHLMNDCTIKFENVKFHRACQCGDKPAELYLVLYKHGNFEISQDDEVIVTGHISAFHEDNLELIKSSSELQDGNDNENEFILSDKDVYRELRLRGYNYRGLFRGIQEAGPKNAKIKWSGEWITFLDNMMQFAIIQADTRSLMVPVGIDHLIIYTKKFNEYLANSEDKLVTVNFCRKTKTIYNDFIEMRGLEARSISRRKEKLLPVLESYEFIPNKYNIDLSSSIRINIQILLENKATTNFKIVEVLEINQESLMNEVCAVIEDLPLVAPDITVVTTKENFQMENVKVQDKITQDNLLFVCQDINDNMILEAEKALTEDGFLLCCNSSNFNLNGNFTLLTTHNITSDKTIYFYRKQRLTKSEPVMCEISDMQTFNWINDLKNKIQTEDDIVLFAQNDYTNGILGFTNCITKEPMIGNKVRCAFVQEPNNNLDGLKDQLAKNMTINVYKNGEWGTYRHLPLPELELKRTPYFYAKTLIPGDLASVNWMEQAKPVGNKDFYMVEYSCLNFRDLMLASGKLSGEAVTTDRFLLACMEGFEFAGYDSSGQAVMGCSTKGIANMIPKPFLTIKKPDNWSMEEAATIPVIYLTCLYALERIGNIQKKQSILIHSATGGIGLGALNICMYYECDIFVTVGTQEKRDYLLANFPKIKSNQIGNSRDTSFKDMVMRETNGRGVDFVLNSLAEEKLQASVECLANGGTFLEIGKYDLEKNNDLKLDLAMKGCKHAGVMLDSIFLSSKIGDLEDLLTKFMQKGLIKPLPRTVFQMDEVDKAYKYMSTGKHIGKVLIKIDQSKDFKVIPKFYCNPNGSYIIFGGLGGFGLELADWLILRGAKNIILTSTRGITTGYQQYRINIWKSYGVKISIVTEDLTNYKNCYDFIKRINNNTPIDAIFNLAVNLKDALWENQTIESMQMSLSPKATLTQHLDKITRQLTPDLRYFVVFSSVSCGRGNAGQTNYGLANSIMERICELRHADGLPALAIQWGAVGDVGILEQLQKENNEIAIGGTLQQKVLNCLEVFEKLILQTKPIVSSMVVAEKFDKGIANTPTEAVFRILGIKDSKEVNKQALLTDLGMDSMTAVEIKQVMERDFDIILSPNLLKTLSLEKLEEMNSGSDLKVEKDIDENASLLSQILPRVALAESTEGIVDFNFSKDLKNENYILAFPGIDGDVKNFEEMAKLSGTFIKCVNYDGIAIDQSNIDTIVEFVLNKLQNDILNKKSFKIIAHSMGLIPAIEVTKKLESSNVFGTLILVDSSPDLMFRFYDNLHINGEDELQCNIIVDIVKVFLPNEKLDEFRVKIRKLNTIDERIDLLTKDLTNISAEIKSTCKRLIHSFMSRLRSVGEYKTRELNLEIKSKVILYKPKNLLIHDLDDDYNLKAICENFQHIDVFEGNHMSILQNKAMYIKVATDFELRC